MDEQKDIKAILLDFDGTIVDLETDYTQIKSRLHQYFEKFGIKKEFSPIVKKINESLNELKEKEDIIKIRQGAYRIINEEEIKAADKATLKEDVLNILHSLRRKFKIAIISRNGRMIINTLLKRFKLPKPDVVVAREDVREVKPAKEHINKALTMLKLKPTECILVGDTIHDLEAGKRFNIPTILITNGFDPLKELLK